MAEIETVETEEAPEIDGMEKNLEDGFNDDPLSDVFNNEKNLEDVEEEPESKEEVPEKKEDDEETGKPAEEEKKAEESPEDFKAKIDALNLTLADERQKKRDAQQRVYDLTHGGQPAETKPETKDEFDWTNPEKTMNKVKNELRQENDIKFLNMSQAQCMQRHDDFGDKYEVFKSMAQANPALVNSMLSQHDPAEWAYSQASNKISMDEIGNDPVAYKEKMKAEILAELKGDVSANKINDIEKKIQQVLPPSANKIKGKIGNDNAPVVSDDPLGDIFGER